MPLCSKPQGWLGLVGAATLGMCLILKMASIDWGRQEDRGAENSGAYA